MIGVMVHVHVESLCDRPVTQYNLFCVYVQFRLSAGSRALSDPEKIFTRQDKIGKGNFGEVYKG